MQWKRAAWSDLHLESHNRADVGIYVRICEGLQNGQRKGMHVVFF